MLRTLTFIIVLCFVPCNGANNFSYRPYPTLLIHGLNSGGKELGYKSFSSAMGTHRVFHKDRIGGKLFWQVNDTSFTPYVPFIMDSTDEDRFFPYENWRAYQTTGLLDTTITEKVGFKQDDHDYAAYAGYNHNFVEVYNAFDVSESNDSQGVRSGTFVANGSNYDVSRGGQTQLLRIRIIQLLNEYYGDFKWVGDPSAKVNLIGHSNGGVLAINMLKHDEEWFNAGQNLRGISVSTLLDGSNGDLNQVIDGAGVRLRDHVNHVVTLNSPLNGTPLTDKDGDYPPLAKLFAYGIIEGGLKGLTRIPGALIKFNHPLNAGIYTAVQTGVSVGLNAIIFKSKTGDNFNVTDPSSNLLDYIYNQQMGGSDAPLIMDLSNHSNFISNLSADGIPPSYNYNNDLQVPVTSYVGVTENYGKIGAVSLGVGVTMTVVSALYIPPAPSTNPFYSIPSVARWGLFTGATTGFMIWGFNSDMVVGKRSQDFKHVFPSSQAEVIFKYGETADDSAFHNSMPIKVANDVVQKLGDKAPSISFTHAIGEVQMAGLLNANQLPVDTFPNNTTLTGSTDAPYKTGVRFKGLDASLPLREQWRAVKNGKITVSPDIGTPSYIVGKIDDYYMNRATVEVKLNLGEWDTLNFYNDIGKGEFGNYAAKYVDMNGDKYVTPDEPGGLDGALFFAKTNPQLYNIGNNLIRVRATNCYGKQTIENIVVDNSVERAVAMETDLHGKTDTNPKLLFQSLQWKDNETKTFTFGYSARVDTTQNGCHFGIDKGNGSYDTLPGSAVTFSPPLTPVAPGYVGNLIQRVSVPFSLLRMEHDSIKNKSSAAMDQTAILTSRLLTAGGDAGSETKMYFSFVIDNDAPVITYRGGGIPYDLNRDGRVTLSGDDANNDGAIDLRDKDYLTNLDSTIFKAFSKDTALNYLMEKGFLDKKLSLSDFDKVDNDGDGIMDADDFSEWMDVPAHSPTLTDVPYFISYNLDDNAQKLVGLGDTLIDEVYKVGSHLPIWADTTISPQLGSYYTNRWDYKDRNGKLADDGLYQVRVKAVDRAGNSAYSDTSYFIVDKLAPSPVEIIRGWENDQKLFDEKGRAFINAKTTYFGFKWRPRTTAGKPHDTETSRLEILFRPVDRDGKLIPADPYRFNSYCVGNDRLNDSLVLAAREKRLVAKDSTILDSVFKPDGKIDMTEFILANDTSATIQELPDGRYITEVIMYDRAGNTQKDPNLSDKVIIVDRQPPVLFEQACSPVMVIDENNMIRLNGKISEPHDNQYNTLGGTGASYNVSVWRTKVDTTQPSQYLLREGIEKAALSGGITPFSEDLCFYSTLIKNHDEYKNRGHHKLIMTAADEVGNIGYGSFSLFYKSTDIGITFPESDYAVRKGADLVVQGSVADPDYTNQSDFDSYRLRVVDTTGAEFGVANTPTGTASSNRIVGLNGVLGTISTATLSPGKYAVIMDVYEIGNPVPATQMSVDIRVVGDSELVDSGSIVEPKTPVIVSRDVPKVYTDPKDTVSIGFSLTKAAADVRVSVVEAETGREVFRETRPNVFPYEGISSDSTKAFRIGRTPQGLTILSNEYGGTILLGGLDSINAKVLKLTGDTTAVTVLKNSISIRNNARCEIVVPETILSGDITISITSPFIERGKIAIGSDDISPSGKQFTLKPSKPFVWNGKDPSGIAINNGYYLVRLSATGTEGIGFAQSKIDTIVVTSQPPLVISFGESKTPVADLIPSMGSAFIPYKVNKVCDVVVSYNQIVGGTKNSYVLDTIYNVVNGANAVAKYEWDGRTDSVGTIVNQSNQPEIQFVAFTKNERDTLRVPVKVLTAYTTLTNDPIVLLGGKKGEFVSPSDSTRSQVISGNSDIIVKSKFTGEYYNPIKFRVKAEVKRKWDFSLSTNTAFTSKVNIKGLVETSKAYKKHSDCCMEKTENVVVGGVQLLNSGKWKVFPNSSLPGTSYHDSNGSSSVASYSGLQFDRAGATDQLFGPLLKPLKNDTIYGMYLSSVASQMDAYWEGDKVGTYSGNESVDPASQWYHWNGIYADANGSANATCSASVHGVFYKDFPILSKTDSVKDTYSGELTVPWNSPSLPKKWENWGTAKMSYIRYEDVVKAHIANGSVLVNDLKDVTNSTDVGSSGWTFNGTFTFSGKNNDPVPCSTGCADSTLSYDDRDDSRQVWLGIAPVLKFKENQTLYLKEKSARGWKTNGVPYAHVNDVEYTSIERFYVTKQVRDSVPVGSLFKGQYIIAKGFNILNGKYYLEYNKGTGLYRYTMDQSKLYTYQWVLGGADSDIDNSVTNSSFGNRWGSAEPCTLFAQVDRQGGINYSLVGDSTFSDVLVGKGDTSFSLIRDSNYIGYGIADNPTYTYRFIPADSTITENDMVGVTPKFEIFVPTIGQLGKWVPDTAGVIQYRLKTETGRKDEFELSIDTAKARVARFIEPWNSSRDKQITAPGNLFVTSDSLYSKLDTTFGNVGGDSSGNLYFRVPAPVRMNDWANVHYAIPYNSIYDSSKTGKYDMFIKRLEIGADGKILQGNTNSNLVVDSISTELFHVDTSSASEMITPINTTFWRYQDMQIGFNQKMISNPKTVSVLTVAKNSLVDSNRTFYSVVANQYGRKIPLVLEDSVGSNRYHFWNSFTLGGPVELHLSYFNKDGDGTKKDVLDYSQVYYSGYLIGENVYPTEKQTALKTNWAAKSGYNKTELIFSDSVKPSFPNTVVGSVFPVNIEDATIVGGKPVTTGGHGTIRSINGSSPIIAATPSPVTFELDHFPQLKYRFSREEVSKMSITAENLVQIYHVNSRNGALTNITTGHAAAYALGSNSKEVFSSQDTANFDDLLTGTNWDYLELTAAPKQFSYMIPLESNNTILDRVQLSVPARGKPTESWVNLNFIKDTTTNAVNKPAKNMHILFDFMKSSDVPDSIRHRGFRSVEYMKAIAGNREIIVPATGTHGIRLDSIIGTKISDGDTLYMYGWCSDDSLKGNSAVNFATFTVATDNKGCSVVQDNRFVSKKRPVATAKITSRESGKLTIVQADQNGRVIHSFEKQIEVDEPSLYSFSIADQNGLDRTDGTYPFTIRLTDRDGNVWQDTAVYSFTVDNTAPTIVKTETVLDTAALKLKLNSLIRDNYSLDSMRVSVGNEAYRYVATSNPDIVLGTFKLPEFSGSNSVEIRVSAVDKAGNRDSSIVMFDYFPKENYLKEWKNHTKVELVLPDSLNITDTLYDMPLLVTLNESNFKFGGESVRKSVRVTNSTNDLLAFGIDEWRESEKKAFVWVRVPRIVPNTKSIDLVVHSGNDTANDVSWIAPLVWDTSYSAVYHFAELRQEAVGADSSTVAQAVNQFVVEGFGAYATGALTVTHQSSVNGGSIGANTGVSLLSDINAGQFVTIHGTVRSAQTISMERGTVVDGDAIAGDSIIGELQWVNVKGSKQEHASVPTITIPRRTIPAIPSNAKSIIQVWGSVDTLFPGTYKTVSVHHASTLHIMPGTIVCDSFLVPGHDSKLIYHLPTANDMIDITVKSNSKLDGYRINSTIEGNQAPERIRFYSAQTEPFMLGNNSRIRGVYTIPDANVVFTPQDTLDGAIYAKEIFFPWHTVLNVSAKKLVNTVELFDDATRNHFNGESRGLTLANGVIGQGMIGVKPAQGKIPAVVRPDSQNYSTMTALVKTGSAGSLTLDVATGTLSIPSVPVGVHHIALTQSGDNANLYLNGVSKTVYSFTPFRSDSTKILGNSGSGVLVDEFRVRSRVLKPTEIQFESRISKMLDSVMQAAPDTVPEFTAMYNGTEAGVQLNVTYPKQFGLEVSRRKVGADYWVAIQPYRASDDVLMDYTVQSGASYLYRMRYTAGTHLVSPWSGIQNVHVPDWEKREFVKIISPAVDQNGNAITIDTLDCTIRLYDAFSGDSVRWSSSVRIPNKAGWIDYSCPVNSALRSILSESRLHFWEIVINGNLLENRIPVVASMNVVSDESRVYGEGSPIGRKNSDVGTLYTDIWEKKLYFKFGPSVHEWKRID